MRNIIILCLKLITLVNSVCCQTCTDLARFGSDISDGVELDATPIAQIRTAGLVVCMKTCLQYKLCEHINFNKQNNQCNLLPSGVVEHKVNTDSISSNRTNWPIRILIGPCFNHTCPASTRCAVQDGKAVCDVIGCHDIPVVSGVNEAGFLMRPLWNINDAITSPCSSSLIPSINVTCQSDGNWTEFSCLGSHDLCSSNEGIVLNSTQKCIWSVTNDDSTWHSAIEKCGTKGGNLLQLKTKEESTNIEALNLDTGNYWIGGNDLEVEGQWKWGDGSSIDVDDTRWKPTNPDNYLDQDCLMLIVWSDKSTNWNDKKCEEPKHYLCERYLLDIIKDT